MRFARILAAVVTTAALAVPTASITTASAVKTTNTDSRSTSASDPAVPKPARVFKHTKIVNLTPSKLQMRTLVVNYGNQPSFLERKSCLTGCKWVKVGTKRTGSDGRVNYPVDAPSAGNWYWRIGTPERAHFRQSYSPIWKTFRN